MGMPRKGSRTVEFDGETYLWRITKKTRYRGDAPLAMTLTVQRDEERPGRVCQVMLRSRNLREDLEEGDYQHRATLHPSEVRQIIAHTRSKGWDPSERGAPFVLSEMPKQPEPSQYQIVSD
jgi:hypothetical protein